MKITAKKNRMNEMVFFLASLIIPAIIIIYSVLENLNMLFGIISTIVVFLSLMIAALVYSYRYMMYKKCLKEGSLHKAYIRNIDNKHIYVSLDDETSLKKLDKNDFNDTMCIVGASMDVVSYKNYLTPMC